VLPVLPLYPLDIRLQANERDAFKRFCSPSAPRSLERCPDYCLCKPVEVATDTVYYGRYPPFLLIMSSCSGSTWVQRVTRSILQAHGGVACRGFEMFNQGKHRERKNDMLTHVAPNAGVAHSFKLANLCAARSEVRLITKVGSPDPAVGNTFKALQVRFGKVRRTNLLDHLVCTARDCLTSETVGMPVDADGSKSTACFQRRNATAQVQTVAWLNKFALLDQLKRLSTMDASGGWEAHGPDVAHTKTFSYELLSQYQELVESRDRSEQLFYESFAEWKGFLNEALKGQSLNESYLSAILRKAQGTRPPPLPHSHVIYNHVEVREVIVQSQFREMWRD
jgi:hypothetical protein